MNKQDLEAFEKWWEKLYSDHMDFRDWHGCDLAVDGKEDLRYGWSAACEYKEAQLEQERAKSAKLVGALEEISDFGEYSDHKDTPRIYRLAVKAIAEYKKEGGEWVN